jgi:phosphoribosylformylglycinamidine synthase
VLALYRVQRAFELYSGFIVDLPFVGYGAADGETVMAPGNIVVSAYARCPDITKTVTPDLKLPGEGKLLLVDLGEGRRRLGGSALAQAMGQLGNEVPDVSAAALKAAFETTQVRCSGFCCT